MSINKNDNNFQNLSNDFVVVGGVLTNYLGNEREVIIPNGVIAVGACAFKGNLRIENVTFPSSLTKIENNAFEGCANLKRIHNPQSVIFYGDEAFKSSGLLYVSIGDRVEHIGAYCFANMPNLETITYMPGKNIRLKKSFAHCPLLSEVEMDRYYFFPSMRTFLDVRNNPNNQRPTFSDAFAGTPFIKKIFSKYMASYKKGICLECGGKVRKGLFHARCKSCKLDYKN